MDEIERKETASAPDSHNQSALASPVEDNSVKSFSKYDFIPGESILYFTSRKTFN